LRAAGEELIGQVAVGQRPGDLQSADHESEDGERVGARRRDLCGVKARRDVVDDAQQLVGEDLSRGVRRRTISSRSAADEQS
jgi:hypothetical protein